MKNSAAPMTAVQQRAQLFMLLRLCAEYRVDLIKQNCWWSILASSTLPEKISRRNVHGRDGIRHQKLRYFH